MVRKIVSGILFGLLIISMFTMALNIQGRSVKPSTLLSNSTSTAGDSGSFVPLPDTFATVLAPGTLGWDVGIDTPCVIYDTGLYKMWYGANDHAGSVGRRVIAYAESYDGITWFNNQIVHDPGVSFDITDAPYVLKEGGTYRMWHADYYEVIAGDWSFYIAHMTSTDGTSWPAFMSAGDQEVLSAQGQSNPQGDGYDITSACVIHEPSGYTMWYTVNDHPQPGVSGPPKIWRATSADGITWSNRQLSLPYLPDTWEGNTFRASVVKEGDGTYTMFYGASYTNGTDSGFGMAQSNDGISWVNRTLFLKPSDLGANVTWISDPSQFTDVNGNRYLYFTYYDGETKFGRIQLGAPEEQPYSISIQSSPSGVQFTVNGTVETTPWENGYNESTVLDMEMPAICTVNGRECHFDHWSDGNTSTAREITLVDASTTLTAYYTRQLTITSSPETGLEFNFNGTQQTTPYSDWFLDGLFTLEMPVSFNGSYWSNWLEDGDTSRTKTVDLSNPVWTGIYTPPVTPIASFSWTPAIVMTNETVTFDASSSSAIGTIVSYEWDLGDNGTASGQIVDHQFADPGNYTVSLNVTDDQGLSNICSQGLVVYLPIHDVAVTNLTANRTVFGQGYQLEVDVTVQNQGTFAEALTVSVSFGAYTVGEVQIPSLDAFATAVLAIECNTTGLTPSTYQLSATAEPVPGETNTADNTFTDGTVTVEAPLHDIRIFEVTDSPYLVSPGTIAVIHVTVQNEGNLAESFNVTVYANQTEIQIVPVTEMEPDSTQIVSINWHTTDFPIGNYTITANITVLPGETNTWDNTYSDDTIAIVNETFVFVSPQTVRVEAGQTFTVDICVCQVRPVMICGVCLEYDPAILHLNSATLAGPGTFYAIIWPGGASGDFVLTHVSFQALTSGVASLHLVADPLSAYTTELLDTSINEIPFTAVDGAVKVGIHDVASCNGTLSKTVVGKGYCINANATIANFGDLPENVKVSMCCSNATQQMLVLPGFNVDNLMNGTFANVVLVWNTTGMAYGNYTVGAYVSQVPSETNTTNNMLEIGWVIVTIPGDINGDGKINLVDLVTLALAYNSNANSARWNANADIDNNGTVGLTDLVILAIHYGQHNP